MKLVKLSVSQEEIDRHNENLKRCRNDFPDLDFSDDAATEDDIICPYVKLINNKDNQKYLDVEDTLSDFTGLYKSNHNFEYQINKTDHKLRKGAYDFIGDFETEVIKPYGVADNATQVVEYFKDYEKRNNVDLGECVIGLAPIVKEFQPWQDGWRWHKWGNYIGVKKPQHEYIAHEDDSIKTVWCYHIYFVEKEK